MTAHSVLISQHVVVTLVAVYVVSVTPATPVPRSFPPLPSPPSRKQTGILLRSVIQMESGDRLSRLHSSTATGRRAAEHGSATSWSMRLGQVRQSHCRGCLHESFHSYPGERPTNSGQGQQRWYLQHCLLTPLGTPFSISLGLEKKAANISVTGFSFLYRYKRCTDRVRMDSQPSWGSLSSRQYYGTQPWGGRRAGNHNLFALSNWSTPRKK